MSRFPSRSTAIFLQLAQETIHVQQRVKLLSLLGQPHKHVLSEVYDILSKLSKALHTSTCMTIA